MNKCCCLYQNCLGLQGMDTKIWWPQPKDNSWSVIRITQNVKEKVFKKWCFKKDGNQSISGWTSLQIKAFITTWRTGIWKVFTTLYNGYKYTDTLMTLNFLSLFNLSPQFQTSESNCLIDDAYIWISNRHFKTDISVQFFIHVPTNEFSTNEYHQSKWHLCLLKY